MKNESNRIKFAFLINKAIDGDLKKLPMINTNVVVKNVISKLSQEHPRFVPLEDYLQEIANDILRHRFDPLYPKTEEK